MKDKIRASVIGGAGYTGGELIRLLLRHPLVDLIGVQSKSNAGKKIYSVHQDLLGETEMFFSADVDPETDVLFLCTGHGDSEKFLSANPVPDHIKIIDLSQDFRLPSHATIRNRNFVYGLPEVHRNSISKAFNVANPGCFATAIQLGLLPLAKSGFLGQVHATGITGSTGAGQSLSETGHFSWRANNIQPYKTLNHQHIPEIMSTIDFLQNGISETEPSVNEVHFIPWRGDFTRGIFMSMMLTSKKSLSELNSLYVEYYRDHPFTHVSPEPVFLKQVVNTNKCLIHLEKVGAQLVVHTAIDNLLKGAVGQAVQNMNLMFAFEETTGLNLKASYF
jgi:N-acetyl-gamma-glutamyl-phosphate reductase